ncbi:unnamed protein product [Linum tenue]|uniref:Uncharacterized protein n=1 Tax=Linum tenue TaxID=586396 RepID=A0AAV0PE23_9ROSI|nr:unnamed protein product [Linum tenue]
MLHRLLNISIMDIRFQLFIVI